MTTDLIRSQSWDIDQSGSEYHDQHYDPNLQIAHATMAMSRCDIIEPSASPPYDHAYDHAYATSPASPYMTSYPVGTSPDHYHMTSYTTSTSSTSTSHSSYHDVMNTEYYPTKIKDEHTYQECALYNDVTMTSEIDDNLPSTLDDIKPDMSPSLLPPLSPEDTSIYFSKLLSTAHNIEPCENESDVPEEVRSLCHNYLPPIAYALSGRHYDYEYDLSHRRHYSDQDSGYCESSDSSSDTPPSTPRHRPTSPYRNPGLIPGPDGLFKHEEPAYFGHDDRGYFSSEDYDGDNYHPRESRNHQKRKMNRGQGRNNKLLWQFMVELMTNPRFRHLADWVDREGGVFRIIQSAKVAELWGKEKGNADMNYEKMSRALRFLRTHHYFEMAPKPYNKRLHFKFGPKTIKLVERKLNELEKRTKTNRSPKAC